MFSLVVLLAVIWLPAVANAQSPGCAHDMQCKGERICQDGRCVSPVAVSGPAAAPTGVQAPTPPRDWPAAPMYRFRSPARGLASAGLMLSSIGLLMGTTVEAALYPGARIGVISPAIGLLAAGAGMTWAGIVATRETFPVEADDGKLRTAGLLTGFGLAGLAGALAISAADPDFVSCDIDFKCSLYGMAGVPTALAYSGNVILASQAMKIHRRAGQNPRIRGWSLAPGMSPGATGAGVQLAVSW